MPAKVTINKDELLGVLMKNRDNHRAEFLLAQGGYRKFVIEELDRHLEDARKGRKIERYISFKEPEDHTEDYDREIRMLQMHTEPAVEIEAHLFDQVVMDNWGWSQAFHATNSMYS